ncbi:hypothetical protein RhiirC2_737568, partial [Rhizophagus irregularis]
PKLVVSIPQKSTIKSSLYHNRYLTILETTSRLILCKEVATVLVIREATFARVVAEYNKMRPYHKKKPRSTKKSA